MKVALLVVHYGDPSRLQRLWASVQAQQQPPDMFLLWNNGPMAELPAFSGPGPTVAVLGSGANLGFGEGINRLLAVCDADVAIVCNPDLELAPDCVRALLAAFTEGRTPLLVGATLLDSRKPARVNAFGMKLTWDGVGINPDRGCDPTQLTNSASESHGDSGYVGPSGALFALHVGRWRTDVGGPLFPASLFLYCEDVALGMKLRLNGHRVPMCSAAIATHAWSVTTGQRSGLKLHYVERNRLWLLRALGGRALALACLPFTVLRYSAYVLQGLGRASPPGPGEGLLRPFVSGLWQGLVRPLPADLHTYLVPKQRQRLWRYVASLREQLRDPVRNEPS